MCDQSLLSSAVEGDSAALGALLKQCAPALRLSLSSEIPRRWRSVLSEDDVMQQTYADAIRDISKFDTQRDGSFSRWMAHLAKCNLRDALRMLKAEKRGGNRRRIEFTGDASSHVDFADMLAGPGHTPSRLVVADEIQSALERALGELPDAYEQVVRMYDLTRTPVVDIAKAIGRSPGAVYMLRARAHDWLREVLGSSTNFFVDSA